MRLVRLERDSATIAGARVPFREVRRGGDLVAIEVAGEHFPVRVARERDRAFVWCAGSVYEVRRATARRPRTRPGSASEAHAGLVAPMPGRIRRTFVHPGDRVEKGQVVLVIEAMKMEHAIRAPRDGVVTRLDHAEGDLVEAGTVLADLEELSPSPSARGSG
jgi:3-methylcrotonyl-CoA carboxylase alpha subunit